MIRQARLIRVGGVALLAPWVLAGCATSPNADAQIAARGAAQSTTPLGHNTPSTPAPAAGEASIATWSAAAETPSVEATLASLPPVPADDAVVLAGNVQSANNDDAGAATQAAALEQPPEVLPHVESGLNDAAGVYPIDFAAALAIAAGQNPQVAFARQRINEAFAQARAADVLWVPSLRAGMNYNKHEGTIQDVAGRMIETSRGSVYSGLGAQAVGAGSPAVPGVYMNFHTKDLLYQPRITEQVLAASRQASRAATNDVLMDTALAYNDLLEALQIEAIARDTLDNATKLAEVTGEFARTGQGLLSDADRAQAELATREIELDRAAEASQIASIRLARLLSQDPTITLVPVEPGLTPIDLAPLNCTLPELVATGLSTRPELAESRFLVGAAVDRLRREQNAPLIPSVLLGLSYGGNGGGLGSDIEDYGDRMDFDAVAFWEVRNLGFGEQAARNEARARLEQARWRQVQALDLVASEVAEAHAQVVARRGQIELAQSGITAARQSYRRNSERIQDAIGLPIEALQAIQALANAQRQYVRSVADYNRAQFRLQRALGWPVQ
jgi:outer membrane protein TolC